jgi:hypothetical protein
MYQPFMARRRPNEIRQSVHRDRFEVTKGPWTSFAPTLAFIAIVTVGVPAMGETFLAVATPGNAFSAQGQEAMQVLVDDGPQGRRFHGKEQRAEVFLTGSLRMPPANTAEFTMQGLTIHFRTNQSGVSLQSVELLNGRTVDLHLETNLQGDYRTRASTKPAALANSWNFASAPIRVGPKSVLRLKVRFAAGFDSPVDPGEFLMVDAQADFPRKPSSSSPPRTSIDLSSALTFQPILSDGLPRSPAAGTIYVVDAQNRLQWYAHTGRDDGTFRWAAPEGRTVGTGWAFRQIFSGGAGVIYAITSRGELLWYHHDGAGNGSFRWTASQGKTIATGWNYPQVFSGGDGSLYAVTSTGDLMWFRHDGHADGSATWATSSGQKVGSGWHFKQLLSGGPEAIYAITTTGDLLWFGHDKVQDGRQTWRVTEGKKIASGWTYPHVFSAPGGVLYAITSDGELLWFRYEGQVNGQARWTAPQGRTVGTGWIVQDIFSGS